MAKDEALLAIQDRLSDLTAAIEAYRERVEAERSATVDNEGLQRLLGLQLKRIGWLLDYLDGDGDETVRDLIDRNHVIEEARRGRFN